MRAGPEQRPLSAALHMASLPPMRHGLVMSWDKQQVEAVVETRLTKAGGKQLKVGPFSVLIVRMHNAGFQHLLKPEVLEQALCQHSRR